MPNPDQLTHAGSPSKTGEPHSRPSSSGSLVKIILVILALVAAGGARQALFANLAGLAATAALVMIAQPSDPWHAVLVWCGGQLFVSPYALWMNGKVLGVGPFRPLRAGLIWLVPCLVAVVLAMALTGGARAG